MAVENKVRSSIDKDAVTPGRLPKMAMTTETPEKGKPERAGNSTSSSRSGDAEDAGNGGDTFKTSPRFWAIMATLCVIGILSALENTVVTTSLPFIVTELDMGENYVWVTNVFFLTGYVRSLLLPAAEPLTGFGFLENRAAVQPLFGQLANVFGRRWVTMAIVALFTLGSGIAGGAHNGATLIAGRAVQG